MNILPAANSKTKRFTRLAHPRTKQTGQAAVEMALTLPILLLILFGIIISVFIFYAIIQVSNATREGARAGTVYRLTMNDGASASLDDAVKNAIYDPGKNVSALGFLSTSAPSFNVGTDVVCTLNGSPCINFDTDTPPHAGDQLSVRVTYRYTMPVVSVALPMFPQPMVLVRTVVMEVQ